MAKLVDLLDSPKLPVAVIITASIWVSTQIHSMKTELQTHFADRISGACLIAIQDELESKNPNLDWLNATEIRAIQSKHPPYARHHE